MTGTVTKGKVVRADLDHYAGTLATTRPDSSGGNLSSLKIGNAVDVLSVFGSGDTSNQTGATLLDAVNALGSADVALELTPGTWTFSANLTLASNFTLIVPAGCVLSPASGITLTVAGVLMREHDTYTGGLGTVTVTGTDNLSSTGGGSSEYAADTGAADAYVVTLSPVRTAYAAGDVVRFKATNANTGASTLNVNALGTKAIVRRDGSTALGAGEIAAGGMVTVQYDGTSFQLASEARPATDLDGKTLLLDADGDTSVRAASDDLITVKVGNSDRIYINATGLGVGSSTPATDVDITNATAPSIHIKRDASNDWYMTGTATGDGNKLSLRHGGNATSNDKVSFQSDGKVGVGTNAPDELLHVFEGSAGAVTADGSAQLVVESNTGAGVTMLSPDASNSNLSFGSATQALGAYARWNYNTRLLTLATNSSTGQISLASGSAAAALRIDANGNVGIGTTSPEAALNVVQGSAGLVSPAAAADDLVLEMSATGGISILSPDASTQNINFGSPTTNAGGQIAYSHSGAATPYLTVSCPAGQVALACAAGTSVLVDSSGNAAVGLQTGAALDTGATDGFAYMPTCEGTPTGTPTAITGFVPFIFDVTNNKLYVYDGGWLATGALT